MKYTAGYKYQLFEDFDIAVNIKPDKDIATQFIVLTTKGQLKILKGYAWDGPSGPTFDSICFMRGSLIHDALYQLIRLGLLSKKWREQADNELKKACLEDGMSRLRTWWVYKGVRDFAGFAIEHRKELFTAPKETE